MNKLRISVIGHLTIDEIEFTDGNTRIAPGGTTFYTSITSSILGSFTKIYSIVGGDYPDEYLEELSKNRVDICEVIKDVECRTTRYSIKYRDDFREMRLLHRAPRIEVKAVEDSDALYLGPVAGELIEDDIIDLSRKFKTVLDPQGILRSIDDCGRIKLEKKIDVNILSKIWLLRLSQEESEILTDSVNPVEACERLLKLGVENVVLSMGSRGLITMNREKRYFIPPYQNIKVIDPTGAGDVLGGAFLVEFLKTRDLAWASSIGASAASISIEDYGVNSILSINFKKNLIERANEILEKIKKL
ncbi:MAG: PfkB family carbohydrate kinase [Aigarchaeota archaeon]|nr:PfkB family carbohydrate kinase [Aigarchaeota archaeon]MCX8193218.1 PfkB family carbohydrate kinase [Nitrososphaeria archaeon]MDW7986359.1 PfkB family carbohydrate kinase [Nitrososphaerota archaeon]